MKVKMKKIISVVLACFLLASCLCFAGLDEGLLAFDKGDFKTANLNLMPLANQGNAVAQRKIGNMYFDGHDLPQSYKEAMAWYRKAAEQGDSGAQNNIGQLYYFGLGVQQDYKEAMAWYRKAAEQGVAFAQYGLATMYSQGKGIPQDYAQAMQWYRKAAEQGLAIAQYSLATAYFNGQGVPQDYAQAMQWYRKAAEQGFAMAQYGLATVYFNGQGVPQDYAQAMQWFRKAAEQGVAEAQYGLGVMYSQGQGAPQDIAQAMQWYKKAADQGVVDAQNNLALLVKAEERARNAPVTAEAEQDLIKKAWSCDPILHDEKIVNWKFRQTKPSGQLETVEEGYARIYDTVLEFRGCKNRNDTSQLRKAFIKNYVCGLSSSNHYKFKINVANKLEEDGIAEFEDAIIIGVVFCSVSQIGQGYEEDFNRERKREIAVRLGQLKSGALSLSNFEDAILLHDPKDLVGVMISPLLRPDNALYAAYVLVEGEDGSLIRVKIENRNGIAYAALRITKKTTNYSRSGMRVGGIIRVIGRYVQNNKYTTIAGQGKIMPVIEVMYIGD